MVVRKEAGEERKRLKEKRSKEKRKRKKNEGNEFVSIDKKEGKWGMVTVNTYFWSSSTFTEGGQSGSFLRFFTKRILRARRNIWLIWLLCLFNLVKIPDRVRKEHV